MMMGVRTHETRPSTRLYDQLGREHNLVLQRAAARGVDKATGGAATQSRNTIRARGLGRLANAVGWTSSLKKGKTTGTNSWGAIFARGGDDSLAGQALQAYSRGATIRPVRGEYLWFQTKALQRRVGRKRMTPARYMEMGSPLGRLLFRRKSARVAEYFVKGAVLSPKGRARIPGRRSRIPTTIVVLFVGIKDTVRLKRWDQLQIVSMYAGLVPAFISDEVEREIRQRRALAA